MYYFQCCNGLAKIFVFVFKILKSVWETKRLNIFYKVTWHTICALYLTNPMCTDSSEHTHREHTHTHTAVNTHTVNTHTHTHSSEHTHREHTHTHTAVGSHLWNFLHCKKWMNEWIHVYFTDFKAFAKFCSLTKNYVADFKPFYVT